MKTYNLPFGWIMKCWIYSDIFENKKKFTFTNCIFDGYRDIQIILGYKSFEFFKKNK